MGTREDREIQAKLKSLRKNIDRNEELMRKAAIDYELLVAEKETLSAAVAELKKGRTEKRRQATQ